MSVLDKIAEDMNRQYPDARLVCKECGQEQPVDWAYLASGWPKCCGFTMTLKTEETI